jgi:hypothetical protein
MSDNLKYFLNRQWGTTSKDGDSLGFGFYNGSAGFTVFRKGEHKPALNFKVDVGTALALVKHLEQATAADPSTTFRKALVRPRYNRDTKQWAADVTLTIVRESNMYSIELSGRGISIIFPVKSQSVLSYGDATMTKEQRSALGIQELTTVLKQGTVVGAMLSTFNNPPYRPGQNNNSSSTTGSSNPDTSSVSIAEEELAF